MIIYNYRSMAMFNEIFIRYEEFKKGKYPIKSITEMSFIVVGAILAIVLDFIPKSNVKIVFTGIDIFCLIVSSILLYTHGKNISQTKSSRDHYNEFN